MVVEILVCSYLDGPHFDPLMLLGVWTFSIDAQVASIWVHNLLLLCCLMAVEIH